MSLLVIDPTYRVKKYTVIKPAFTVITHATAFAQLTPIFVPCFITILRVL